MTVTDLREQLQAKHDLPAASGEHPTPDQPRRGTCSSRRALANTARGWLLDRRTRPSVPSASPGFASKLRIGDARNARPHDSSPRMMRTYLFGLALLVAGHSLHAQATPAQSSISLKSFSSLRWLAGRWVGSGGGFAAFYEEYRLLNDSTIEQRTFPDSTFGTPDGTSTIEWRAGAAQKLRRGRADTQIARIVGDTSRFEPARTGVGGFTWIRISDREWRAVLDGPSGRPPTIYQMRRFAPGR
jgi:hypothetical protein